MSAQNDANNQYPLDAEHESELTRLIRLSRFMTSIQGGIFSDHPVRPASRVVDLACGPGDWALDFATKYQSEAIEVVGIDISKRMIMYAQAQAATRRLKNVNFVIGDVLQPLPFPDQHFEIVNARFLTFMPALAWDQLLQDCYRILKPGGVIRLIESEAPLTNSAAYEKFVLMMVQAVNKAGQGFSATGYAVGTTVLLHAFLERNNFSQVQERALVVNYSYRQLYYETWYQNYMIVASLLKPFLLKYQVTSAEEFETTLQQMQKDMREPSFCALNYMLVCLGKKPEAV